MVGIGLWIEGEATIGERLVTGGVAAEVICAWWVLVASRKLQNILEREFETLRLETAQVNERAAEADRHAAEANEKAEHERFERLQLEKRLEWRSLSGEQQELVSAKFQTFAGHRIDIFMTSADGETVNLANTLRMVMLEAGLTAYMYQTVAPVFPVMGIMIEYDSRDTFASQAAESLHKVLTLCGLWTSTLPFIIDSDFSGEVQYVAGNTTPPPDAQLRLVIGDKSFLDGTE